MKSAKFFLILFLLFFVQFTWAESVVIAPFLYYGSESDFDSSKTFESPQIFIQTLRNTFKWNDFYFNPLPSDIMIPGSFLEAMEICNNNNIEYLLYGFIEDRDFYLYGEIKLFNKEKREVVKAFYSSDDLDQKNRLLIDLAEKLGNYLNEVFDVKPAIPLPEPKEGIISFLVAPGYSFYLTQEWADYLVPLYSFDYHTYFTPIKPGEGLGFRGLYFKTGLNLTFNHSINRMNYEQVHLLGFSFGIPLGLMADWGVHHSLGIFLTPEFYVDYLIRTALYNEPVYLPEILFSTSVSLNYSFHFNRFFSLGLLKPILFTF